MIGTAQADIVTHSGTRDVVILGGDGDDRLTGGGGDDVIAGNGGADACPAGPGMMCCCSMVRTRLSMAGPGGHRHLDRNRAARLGRPERLDKHATGYQRLTGCRGGAWRGRQ